MVDQELEDNNYDLRMIIEQARNIQKKLRLINTELPYEVDRNCLKDIKKAITNLFSDIENGKDLWFDIDELEEMNDRLEKIIIYSVL